MSNPRWRLWLLHTQGGGWMQTRLTCGHKSKAAAELWADKKVLSYKLSSMLYEVRAVRGT